MAVRERLVTADTWIAERTTWAYQTPLRDELGIAIPSYSLSTVTLTLYDLMTSAYAIVNGVDDINILNTGRGAVDADGKLTVTLTPADTQILDATRPYERRLLLIEWTYAAGAKAGKREVEVIIKNLARVS